MEFLRPSPAVLALISLQSFIYLPVIVVLSACRAGAARRTARWLALASLLIALIGIASHFGPPLLKLYTGPIPLIAGKITKTAGGMALPLVASLPLLISAFAPGCRWRWVDVLHVLALLALVGLWGWTRYY